MPTNVLKALPGKLDINRCSPSILYISANLQMSLSVLKALPGKLDIKRHSHSILYLSRQALRCQQAFSKPCLVNLISKETHLVLSISQQAWRCQQAFSKPSLVNLISKDIHLVFSIYGLAMHLVTFKSFLEGHIFIEKQSGDKDISILHLTCKTSDLQFSLVLQTHALVLYKEYKGVICYMTSSSISSQSSSSTG